MKPKRAEWIALTTVVSILSMAGNVFAAGTDDERFFGDQATRKRVGIIAYCADMYHNAGDTGLQSNKASIQNGFEKSNLADLADNGLLDGSTSFLGNWFTDGPFSNLGQYGAQNVVDYLAYDDGIDRARDLQLIDGDLVQPTGQQLINNFDIVIAYTDNKCGEPIPAQIANQAAGALNGFLSAPDKKLILTGFAFSSTLGFGNAIYGAGRSPLTKGGPDNAACTREAPCVIGTCPAGCSVRGNPPECFDDETNAVCTVYQPNDGEVLGTNNANDLACRELLNNVRGPTSSSWATALTGANVAPGASLCMNYDTPDPTVPFAAINANRNIVAINAFPPDAEDIQKFWFGCILGNVVQYLSGDTSRCGGNNLFCN